ncbi:MAG: phosphatase PAP2 family protein [Candidatus Aenigmarchaeota archaeon]|nr:phosphatase PAP2 family protein [Candidatus Aenigmarchaeota archaeon]
MKIFKKLPSLLERKPFHALALVLLLLNVSGIAAESNYASFVALVAVFLSAVTSVGIKMAMRTARPRLNKYRIIKYGFPSSHTQIAFSVVTVYANYAPQLSSLFFTLAILVAAARVYIKAHKKIDVVGGAALGILTGALSIWSASNLPVFA